MKVISVAATSQHCCKLVAFLRYYQRHHYTNKLICQTCPGGAQVPMALCAANILSPTVN